MIWMAKLPNPMTLATTMTAKTTMTSRSSQARAAGFDNLGVDLIYGLPGQTMSDWLSDLEQVLHYRPEPLSCSLLTFEPGTPMTRDLERGRLAPLEESLKQ